MFKVDSNRNHGIKHIFYGISLSRQHISVRCLSRVIAVRPAFCHWGIHYTHLLLSHSSNCSTTSRITTLSSIFSLAFSSVPWAVNAIFFKLKWVNLLRKLFITSFRILMRPALAWLYKMESICTFTHKTRSPPCAWEKHMLSVAIRALQWWHVITIKLNHSTSQFLKLHPPACIVYYYFIFIFYHRCGCHHLKFRVQANAWQIYWRLVNILKLGLFATWNVIRCVSPNQPSLIRVTHFHGDFSTCSISAWIDVHSHTHSYCFNSAHVLT